MIRIFIGNENIPVSGVLRDLAELVLMIEQIKKEASSK